MPARKPLALLSATLLARFSAAQFNVYPTCVQPLLTSHFPAECLADNLIAQNTCLCQAAGTYASALVTAVYDACGCADLATTVQLSAAYCVQVGIDVGPAFDTYVADDTPCDGGGGGSGGAVSTIAPVVASHTVAAPPGASLPPATSSAPAAKSSVVLVTSVVAPSSSAAGGGSSPATSVVLVTQTTDVPAAGTSAAGSNAGAKQELRAWHLAAAVLGGAAAMW